MRVLLVLSLLCIHATWGLQQTREPYTGWHEKVGIKYAQDIKQYETEHFNSRIVGGNVATVNAHPYLAGLLIDVFGLNAPSACGGSILTSTRVLTAAHCWNDGRFQAWRIQVVLGSPFLFHGGLRIFASSIALHQNYDHRTFANDIAMLYLPNQIPFSNQIRPITLPSGPFLTFDYAGSWALASGYGRYSDLTIPTTNTMVRNVVLQVISLEQCRRVYGSNVILDSNVCTNGVGGVGICQGDSGGPLTVFANGGQEILLGVSSFVAYDGCQLGHPSAYASVPKFIDWIHRHL